MVAKNQAVTVTAGDVINSIADLADGDVVVTDLKNTVLDAASLPATLPAFKMIARSGSALIHSDVIEQGLVRKYDLGLQASESQQLDYVGFNGVSGSLDEIASNIYTIRLYYQEELIAGFMQQKIKEGFYKSNAVAASYAQGAVAEGLVHSLIANYSREAEKDITFGMTNSGANTDIGTGAGSVTFTQGSKYAVFGTDITDATTNAALAVGDLLAVSDAKTESMYRVVAIDAATESAELDRPFQEATATVANATVGRVLAAAATAGDYGVKLQGVDRLFKTGYFASRVARWKTTFDFGDAASAAAVSSTAAYPGVGTGQQVATLEKELQADEHIYRLHVEGGVVDRTQADSTLLYDVTVVEFDGEIQSGIGTPVKSPKTLQVALEGNTAQGDDTNVGIITTLNAIIVTLWAVPGTSAKTPTA